MEATTLKKPRRRSAISGTFLKTATLQTVYFLLGLLVSTGAVFGELSPFGVSLAAAVPLKYTGASIAGSSLGYIFHNPRESFRYIGVLLAIGALKWLFSDIKKISHSQLFAPLLSFVPMTLTGVALLFVSGSKVSAVSTMLIEAILSAVGAYFLKKTVELSESTKSLKGFSTAEVTSLTVTAAIVIFSFGGVEVFSLSLGRILAIIGILVIGKYGGTAFGTIAGVATGVLFSLSSKDLSFLPGCFALGGLSAGLSAPLGKLPAGVSFVLCSTLLSFGSDQKSLTVSIFIEALLGMGIFMLIPQRIEKTFNAYFLPYKPKGQEAELQRGVIARLRHASNAIDGVSACVREVTDRLQKDYPQKEEDYIYKAVAQKACKSCGLRNYCFTNQKEVTGDDFKRTAEILKEEGYISEKQIEEIFSKRCHKTRELAEGFNTGYIEYRNAISAKRRISELRGAISGQFSGLSLMLSDLSEELETMEYLDTDASESITRALHYLGIVVTSSCAKILGGNRMVVEVNIADSPNFTQSERELRKEIEKATGRPFEVGSLQREGGSFRLSLMEITPYDVEIGSSQHISEGGNLCGDTLDYFLTGDGSLYAIISDGMGTGGCAAVDSNMAVSIMTKLIKAGLSPDSALQVANSSLMIKSEEESAATLDVLECNLFTGKITLNKAGAPLTLIKRGGRVHRREYPSLPIGILNEVKLIKESMTLREGDSILMVSDGAVTQNDKWLEDMVRGWEDAPSSDFASMVVNEAMKRRKDSHDDDITAIALKLVANG